jgi:hypothetical protein
MACTAGEEVVIRLSRRVHEALSKDFEAYMAGKHASERDMHMARARLVKDPAVRKLYAGFARDAHREYLEQVRQIHV